MIKLATIKKEWEKYIILKDAHIVDVVFSTLVGNIIIQREPIWTMIVAPSSGGKSTLIAPTVACPSVHFLDDLTEKSLLSGYKIRGKEMSLLKIIGSGIICFSDFTAILSKNPMSKNEILGQLRLVYDGNFSRRTGTGEIKWSGKIGCLAACTPDIYHQLEGARSQGERMLYYSMQQPTDDEIVAKQEEVSMSSREISEAMQPFYSEYMLAVIDHAQKYGVPELKMTPEQIREIHEAAKFCVNAKATVHLDFKSGLPDALVNKPGVGRDRKMFQTVLHALLTMANYEDGTTEVTADMVAIVKKMAWSSVSRERRKILEILTQYNVTMSASEIGASNDFGLQKDSVLKYLHALFAVGLVQKTVRGNNHVWSIDSEETKKFVTDLSGVEQKELVKSEADMLFDGYESSTV